MGSILETSQMFSQQDDGAIYEKKKHFTIHFYYLSSFFLSESDGVGPNWVEVV